MSPSSTSNSERDWDIIPEAPAPVLRWSMVAILLVAAELFLRMGMSLDMVEQPVLFSNESIDEKVHTFLDDFVPADLPGERILVIGSSVAATNVAPGAMTEEIEQVTGDDFVSFNWGVYGGRFADFEFVADWAYKQWNYDHMVIVLEPWSFRYYSMGIDDRLDKFPLEFWLMRHTELFAIRNQFEWWDESVDNNRRGVRDLDSSCTLFGWNRTVYPPPPDLTSPENAVGNANSLYIPGTDNTEPYEPRFEIPTRMRDQANRRGVPVYWVLPPQRPDLEQHMPEQFDRESRREIARQLADAPDNYVVDMMDLETEGVLDFDEFFDSTHLHGRGAITFSTELGQRLAPLVSDE